MRIQSGGSLTMGAGPAVAGEGAAAAGGARGGRGLGSERATVTGRTA
jgi:hypothetical protein